MKNLTIFNFLFFFIYTISACAQNSPRVLSTYLGGTQNDKATIGSIAVNEAGDIYIVSQTKSSNFPVTEQAYDTSYNGEGDICVTLMKADLSEIIASTFIGGTGSEYLMRNTSLILDDSGNVLVAGQTNSFNDFPTTPGAYQEYNIGGQDVFIVKLSPDLSTIIASTLIGSPYYDEVNSIKLDSEGNIIVAGYTRSEYFPFFSGCYDTTYNGTGSAAWGGDIFITKFSSDLTELLAATFLGGSNWEDGGYVVIDDNDNIYVTGTTRSVNFPTTLEAFSKNYQGGSYGGDIFISKLDNSLKTLIASTFVGGTANDWSYFISLDQNGDILITGHTASLDFPNTPGVYQYDYIGVGGDDLGDDILVSNMSANLDSMLASTFLGGTGWENGSVVIADENGKIYVGGNTNSSDFHKMPGCFDTLFNGGAVQYAGDAVIAVLNNTMTELLSSTYLGGIGQESIQAMAINTTSVYTLYMSGITNSINFPFSAGVYDTLYNGGAGSVFEGDAFIAAFPVEHFVDSDTDGVVNYNDNCPGVYNPDQADLNENNIGDACESCCRGDRGNADCSEIEEPDISDITRLIDFLYITHLELCCEEEADADGSGGEPDISDITRLIDFLYISNIALAPCL